MKFKKMLLAGLMGMGLALGIGFTGPELVDAYQVDEESPVYYGFDGRTWNYCAVIIYEDNGDANTYYYKFEYGTDFMYYKINDNKISGGWIYLGRGIERQSIDQEVIDGYHACYNKFHQNFKHARVTV